MLDNQFQASASILNQYHLEKLAKRKLPLDEIFDKLPWFQSVKRVALLLYRVCQSYKTWSAEIGQTWIAKQVVLSRVTVNQALMKLERCGLIKIFRRERGMTHTYQFNVPEWLDKILSRLPRNKHCNRKQVLSGHTQSNIDLSTYKQYTKYLDSKEVKIDTFRKRNPDKAKEYDEKYAKPTQEGSTVTPYIHKDVKEAPKAVGAMCLKALKHLFKGF